MDAEEDESLLAAIICSASTDVGNPTSASASATALFHLWCFEKRICGGGGGVAIHSLASVLSDQATYLVTGDVMATGGRVPERHH